MTTALAGSARAAVASEVRAEAARQRWSQTRIAMLLATSQASISRKYRAEVAWDVDELYALADAWNVPVSGLLPSLEAIRSIPCFTDRVRAASLQRAS